MWRIIESVWTPRIESIKRPVHYVALQGVITTVHSNSGLIKRCNKCKSIVQDSCPHNCKEGWGWDLRVSSRLYDGSGSIKMILTKDIASTVLQKSLGELILLASQPIPSNSNRFQISLCNLKNTRNHPSRRGSKRIHFILQKELQAHSYRRTKPSIPPCERRASFHRFQHKTIACW
jgi:hypothetical protein